MLDRMVDHMHWANAQVIEWIKADRKEAGELRKLISHIVNVERVWINRAEGRQGDRETFKVHEPETLAALNDANHRDAKTLLEGDVKSPVEYRMFDGTPARTRIEDMLIHAFSHGFHHVGQMAALASRSGEKFPGVSYLAFSRTKPAEGEQPEPRKP